MEKQFVVLTKDVGFDYIFITMRLREGIALHSVLLLPREALY